MFDWPFTDPTCRRLPDGANLRAEDAFLLWLMRLPLDADTALAAHRLLASAPESGLATPFQRRLHDLLVAATQVARAA